MAILIFYNQAASPVQSNITVDPYASALTKVLDETADSEPLKFVPNKTRSDMRKNSSKNSSAPSSSPMEICQKPGNDVKPANKPDKVPPSSNPRGNGDEVMNEDKLKPKIKSDVKRENYKDTALEFLPPPKPLGKLSVAESIEMSKVQLEKEKRIGLIRKVELINKYYDKLDDVPDEEEYADDYESDNSGCVSVVKYE